MTHPNQIGQLVRTPATAGASISGGKNLLRRIFSFPVMCMFLLAAVIFAYAPRGIGVGEPDIWWRFCSAAESVQHHTLNRVDIYSFTAAGFPWTNFEWLSDLWFFVAFKNFGLQGLLVLYSMAMVLIFAGVYYRAIRAGADCKDAALVTVAGICLAAVALAPRPLVFGWLCLTVLLLVLDRFQRTGTGLWILPPLFIVWINLHGSWVYGLAVLAIIIGSGLVQGRWGSVAAERWSPAELKKLLLASAASIAALFVNPFGYKLVLFPLEFFRERDFMQYTQLEYWQPVDFSTWNGKLALCLIFGIIAAAVFSRRRWQLSEVLLLAFALWSGLSHVRFLDFAAIISVPILAPRVKLFPPYEPGLDKPWLNAVVMAAILGFMIALFPSAKQLQQQVDSEYPTAALIYMHQNHVNGRIFSPAEFGGFIEWNAPEFKSFSDGRAIFVKTGIFQDGMNALTMREPFKILDKYQINYVLLEPTWPLAFVLEHSPDWRLIYSDHTVRLFERSSAKEAAKQ